MKKMEIKTKYKKNIQRFKLFKYFKISAFVGWDSVGVVALSLSSLFCVTIAYLPLQGLTEHQQIRII